jgi:ribokinase
MVCALGDLLLDVVVRLDGPIAEDTDTYGRTHVGPGGQAANVAAWVVALGGRARFLGKWARDAAGRIVAEELRSRGVEVAGPRTEGPTGTVVSVATPDGRRTMLTDRGIAPDFSPDELEREWVAGCAWVHLPAYSLVRSPIAETALAAARLARTDGARISVDLSSPTAIRELGVEAFRRLLRELEPDAVLGTEDETALVGDVEAPVTVVKLGARGCRVRRGSDETEVAAKPTAVVDTTGAGDAFAAGFLLDGAELAVAAAARCVSRPGAMP